MSYPVTAGSPNIIIEEASYIKPGKTRKRSRGLSHKNKLYMYTYVRW